LLTSKPARGEAHASGGAPPSSTTVMVSAAVVIAAAEALIGSTVKDGTGR
jgi:hypothetical protein